jgi:putative N6-adenine-specific DNA methylase
MSAVEQFFAPCPRGLEAPFVEELLELGIEAPLAVPGGVGFAAPLEAVYRVNHWSRIASRILLRVAEGEYGAEEDIYQLARGVAWEDWFKPVQTLRVDLVATKSPLTSLKFTTLRVKDAICDRLRELTGIRPNIDKLLPDVRVHVYLDASRVFLYLDTSGEALFKRGYRSEKVEAPLRENLAAGILRLIGWTPAQPLYDPMCGSGTFLIEAARIALGLPPAVKRRYGFERLSFFEPKRWEAVRTAAARPVVAEPRIFGSDISPQTLRAAVGNFNAAGVGNVIRTRPGDLLKLDAPCAEPGIMIANPPYGERIGNTDELDLFYPELGHALKNRYAGWNCYFISGDRRLEKLIRLKASRRTPLMNGDLDCRLYEFRMVAGGNRRPAGPDAGPAPGTTPG